MITLDAQHPWPGLLSFTEDLQPFFHGRDEELDDLLRRVSSTVLTVLFGESGLGKTSLLQAGLFPRLRRQGFLPVSIRLDCTAAAPAYGDQVKEAMARALKAAGLDDSLLRDKQQSLWEYFHRKVPGADEGEGEGDGAQPPRLVLAFDQFEELFTQERSVQSAARIAALFTELGDLIENRIPASLRKSFEENSKLMKGFAFQRQDHRVLLSLREDYLARLEELRQVLPAILANRMRLTRMRGAQALEAVLEPGAGLLTASVARQIVRFVAGAGDVANADLADLEVEPWLLSLVCFELNAQRLNQRLPGITEDLLAGSRDQILQNFYQDCLRDQAPAVRVFVEEELLTHNQRDSVELVKAERKLTAGGAPASAIADLVHRRLLHLESLRGMQRIELTHDVLINVVRKSRDERRQQEAVEQARQHETKLREQAAAAARRREQEIRQKIKGLLVLLLLFAGLAGYAFYQAYLAREAAAEANENKKLAETARVDADAAAKKNRQLAVDADDAARRATQMKDRIIDLFFVPVEHANEQSYGKFSAYLDQLRESDVPLRLIQLKKSLLMDHFGRLLMEQRKFRQAEDAFRAALEIDKSLVRQESDKVRAMSDPEREPDQYIMETRWYVLHSNVAVSHERVAWAQFEQLKLELARNSQREAKEQYVSMYKAKRATTEAHKNAIKKAMLRATERHTELISTVVLPTPTTAVAKRAELTTQDIKDRKNEGSYCKIFAAKLTGGEAYLISMASEAMKNVSLRLEDATGAVLAREVGKPAHISFICRKDGVYSIIAATFNDEIGPFTLTIEPRMVHLDLKPNDITEVVSELNDTDLKDRVRDAYCKVYSVKLKKGTKYQIDMKTRSKSFDSAKDLDPYLRLEDATGKILKSDDDGGGFPNARIEWRCTEDGTYQIIATTFKHKGPFTLSVQEK